MIRLTSSLENKTEHFDRLRELMNRHDFSVGGGWEYDHGTFDRALDEQQKIWLRIPFRVTDGYLDADAEQTEAIVRMEGPFVLKHLYQEGLDHDAGTMTSGGLMNQFQDPVDKDAEIETEWVDKARMVLEEVEREYF